MKKVLTEKKRKDRDEKIRKLYSKGLSTRQIAKKVGLSKTRVHEIVAYN